MTLVDAPSPDAVAATLRAAREATGLSCRAFAARLGLSAATVSAMENGRQPKWSTLMRYVACAPGLDVSSLVGGAGRASPITESIFEAWTRAHGAVARAVTVEVDVRDGRATSTCRVEGLAGTGSARGDDAVLALMQVACSAPNALLRTLAPPAPGGTLDLVDDAGTAHAFRVSASGGLPRLDYVRRSAPRLAAPHGAAPAGAPSWDGESLAISLAHPAERLDLVLRTDDGVSRRLRVGTGLRDDDGARNPALHSGGSRVRRSGDVTRATLRHVLPGFEYALVPASGPPPPAWTPVPEAASFGDVALAVRDGSGLTQRALAARMGVSHVTVLEAERSRDVTASTLSKYLAALPDLPPALLLPARESAAASVEDAWIHQRDAIGFVADEVRKVLTLTESGDVRNEQGVTGFRSVGHATTDVRVLLGARRAAYSSGDHVLEEILSSAARDADELRTRRITRSEGSSSWQLAIPRGLSGKGVDWSHVWTTKGAYLMTDARARARHGNDERTVEGTTLAPPFPCRRLHLEVRFPARCFPSEAWCIGWTCHRLPSGDQDALADGVHALRHDGRLADERRHRLVLRVDMPLHGLKYGLGWYLR